MKGTSLIATTVFVLVAFVAGTNAQAQNYDNVLKALSRLDASIKVLKQNYPFKNRMGKQYAEVDGRPSATDLQRDPWYEFAINLEDVVHELQGMVVETKKAGAARPKNSAAVGHGRVTFSGFVHQQYYNQQGDNEQSTFRSKRARLGIKGKINEYAKIKIMGEFADSPKLLDGALTLSPNKYWAITVGQYKPPFGSDFLRPATAFPFVNTSKAKGLGTGRDIGASVTYKNKVNKDLTVKFSGGFFNGSGINTSDVNTNKNFIGRSEFQLSETFTVAANAIVGKTNDTASAKQDLNTYGGSATWNWKNEIVEGEYIYSEVGNTKKAGWYVWGGHSFVTNSPFLPKIQLLARYEQLDTDLDVNDNMVDRITIGTNLFIDKKYTKIQFNYQINGEETGSVNNDEFWTNFQVAF
jgi:hypothetical protein